MKTLKTLSIVSILFFAFSVAVNAQGLKYVKIKTSAQSALCKENIEKMLHSEKGVKDAVLDLKTKTVVIKYSEDKTNYKQLSDAIVKLGYDADHKKADKDAYSKLPDNCKKAMSKNSNCGSSLCS